MKYGGAYFVPPLYTIIEADFICEKYLGNVIYVKNLLI